MRLRRVRQELIYVSLMPLGTVLLAGIIAIGLLVWGVNPGSVSFWLIFGAVVAPFAGLDVYLWFLRRRGLDLRTASQLIVEATERCRKVS